MTQHLARLAQGAWYWLFLATVGLAMESTALYYQYVLDYGPCVLCIHVRMLVFALVLLSLLMAWARRSRIANVVGHLGALALLSWLTERSWQLLATERGWTFGSCEMRSGLPDWVALEDWAPFLFRIHEPCGYTPIMPFGVTMAEALIVIAGLLSVLAATLSVAGAWHAVRG